MDNRKCGASGSSERRTEESVPASEDKIPSRQEIWWRGKEGMVGDFPCSLKYGRNRKREMAERTERSSRAENTKNR